MTAQWNTISPGCPCNFSTNAGSVTNFRSTSPKQVFINEISSSTLLDIQLTLHYVCGVDSFIPELEHLQKNFLTVSFPKRRLWNLGVSSGSVGFVIEMKLRSTFSAEQNFPDEITWINWKTKPNLEIWQFLEADLEISLWDSIRKLFLLPVWVDWTYKANKDYFSYEHLQNNI